MCRKSPDGHKGGHRRRAKTRRGGYKSAGSGGLRAKALLPGRLLPTSAEKLPLSAVQVQKWQRKRSNRGIPHPLLRKNSHSMQCKCKSGSESARNTAVLIHFCGKTATQCGASAKVAVNAKRRDPEINQETSGLPSGKNVEKKQSISVKKTSCI